MEVMSNQYSRVKKNYGIDEALAESSESEPDEYISKLSLAYLVLPCRIADINPIADREKQKNQRSSQQKPSVPAYGTDPDFILDREIADNRS